MAVDVGASPDDTWMRLSKAHLYVLER